MIERFKSLFARKAEPAPIEPVGDTTAYDVYCTRREIAQPAFAHKLHARRDLSDPALWDHLNGFCRQVQSRGDGQMSRDKYHLILHLQRVQHHLCISVAAGEVSALFDWAGQANGVVVTPEGHICDPDGDTLISAVHGTKDTDARMPYLPGARSRQMRTEAALAARGINVARTLPPLICEDELQLRDKDEVVERARALLLVALRAESVASGQPIPVEMLLSKMPLADDALSPKEQAFLAQETPSQQDCAPFIWRYESLYLLEWVLCLVDELPYPGAPVDAASTVATLIEMRGPRLRGATEILDALDLHYRLHWQIRQSRLKKLGETADVDADVVMERHHTLNWLVRFQHASWDEVDTPT